ncbi:MAG: EI24 domain-containing protein, partial [Rhodobacteraceae bacterium]|nr:EI24 domain-containing protein [Paracoccaceae bacterium]
YLLLPPLAPFVFWLVNGFLLGREYFQLVAMRRLGPEGAARLRRANAGRIWLAGTAMAVPLSVPVLNLLVPILGVAVFTHQLHRMAPAS